MTTADSNIKSPELSTSIDATFEDPIERLVDIVRHQVRHEDAFAIGTVIQNISISENEDPLLTSHVLHSSLTANALFDGATQNELNYLKPPPMNRVEYESMPSITLPEPADPLGTELSDALEQRCSDYNFSGEPISLEDLSTLLHHAAGVSGSLIAYNVRNFPKRRFPTAGGLQPVDIMLAINDVVGVSKGLYYFHPFTTAFTGLTTAISEARYSNQQSSRIGCFTLLLLHSLHMI